MCSFPWTLFFFSFCGGQRFGTKILGGSHILCKNSGGGHIFGAVRKVKLTRPTTPVGVIELSLTPYVFTCFFKCNVWKSFWALWSSLECKLLPFYTNNESISSIVLFPSLSMAHLTMFCMDGSQTRICWHTNIDQRVITYQQSSV